MFAKNGAQAQGGLLGGFGVSFRKCPANVMAAGVVLLLLSMPLAVADEIRRVFGVETAMRDGVTLVSDIWMPDQEGRYPVILLRTPYERTMQIGPSNHPPEYGAYFANHGYVWMIQDTRGRGDSHGDFSFFQDDAKDGYDTIEWIAKQPWSNGRVCMMGPSYLGTVQWLAASAAPPALKCIAPTAAAGRWFEELPYLGGAFTMQFMLSWTNGVTGHLHQGPNMAGVDWGKAFMHRPLLTMDEAAFGRKAPVWRNMLQHDTFDEYWENIYLREPEDFVNLKLPALHIAGLFDWDQPGAMRYWRAMQAHSPARDDQFLLVGPWTHLQTWTGGNASLGEWSFGDTAVVDYKPIHLAFFDRYLKEQGDVKKLPRARIFFTGTNVWRDFPAYPPASIKVKKLFLHTAADAQGGTMTSGAAAIDGSGRLRWEKPGDQTPDRYAYDPLDPVPSQVGGADPRGIDHRIIEERPDVLVYTSAILDEPVTIIGAPVVRLWAASDAKDTDFTAKLLDVAPDGLALKLGPTEAGIIRARYRGGYTEPKLLKPGAVEAYDIQLFDVAHVFLPGHQIRLEIASSAFPFVDANTNTGNRPSTDTEWVIANQTIYHDKARPSHIELPVMPSE